MEFAEPVAKRTEMLELGLVFRIRDTREINLEKLLKTRAIRGRVQDAVDVIEDILGCGIFADGSIDLRPDMLIEVWPARGINRAGFGIEVEGEDIAGFLCLR